MYGGLVFMDFNEDFMRQRGHGDYRRMDPDLLQLDRRPGLLYLMFCDNPSDSGAVHADVRQRWDRGDVEVHSAMQEVAECARRGRCVGGWCCAAVKTAAPEAINTAPPP